MLDARQALLAALGPSAALAGEPLRYAADGEPALNFPQLPWEPSRPRRAWLPDEPALVLPLDPGRPGARNGRCLCTAAGLGPAS